MPRRFITRTQIDDLADAGQTVLEVDRATTVTDLAREHAQQRGVRIVQVDAAPTAGHTAGPTSRSVTDDDPRAAIRRSVIARLGSAPANLDETIDRVLRQQG